MTNSVDWTSSVDWTPIVRELLKNQTQVKLSEKTGVHQGVISDMYRGIPKPNLTYTYGKALEVAYDELVKQTKQDASKG